MEYKDQYNNEIKVGDIITYPGRVGSSLWMNTAVVESLDSYVSWRRRESKPRLGVSVFSETYVYSAPNTTGTWKRSLRKTRIERIDNVTVVTSIFSPTTDGEELIQKRREEILAEHKQQEDIQCTRDDTYSTLQGQ